MNALMNIDAMSDSTMGEILNQMTEINADKVAYVFTDKDNTPVAAVVVLKGDETKACLEKLEARETRLPIDGEVAV